MPEIRGEPSARNVAIVLCLPTSKSRRTRAANSASACSRSLHAAIAAVCAEPDLLRHNLWGGQAAGGGEPSSGGQAPPFVRHKMVFLDRDGQWRTFPVSRAGRRGGRCPQPDTPR